MKQGVSEQMGVSSRAKTPSVEIEASRPGDAGPVRDMLGVENLTNRLLALRCRGNLGSPAGMASAVAAHASADWLVDDLSFLSWPTSTADRFRVHSSMREKSCAAPRFPREGRGTILRPPRYGS